MKKSLLSLAIIALSAITAMAGTETFNVGTAEFWGVTAPATGKGVDLNNVLTFTQGDITIVFNKNNASTANRLWNANGTLQLRMYAKSSISVTSATGVITDVEFTGNTPSLAPNTGTIDSGKWNGSAQSVVFTNDGKPQLTSIVVTYGEAAPQSELATPVIEGTTPFLGSTTVTISCETENVTIYYTTNGDTPTAESTLYTAPFAIEEACTVKAIAILDDKTSAVASKEFVKQINVATAAEIEEFDNGTEFTFTGNLTVIGQTGQYLYAQDATGGAYIYGSLGQTYEMGDVIPAGWSATKSTYRGATQASSPKNFQAATATAEIEPIVITTDEVENHLFEYVVIKNVTINATGKTLTDDNGSVAYFTRFSVNIPTGDELNKKYDVSCIASFFDAVQVIPLSIDITTGINDITVDTNKTYKTIENGQVIIVKNGIRYNTMGQIVK